MPPAFTRTSLPGRVVFGAGALARLGGELEALGAGRVMLIVAARDANLAEAAGEAAGGRRALTWTEVAQHVPRDLATRAIGAAREAGVDVLVTIGGGSTTGLGKAIAVETKLPLVVVPTTYAGSEMTPIYGLTSGNHKQTGRDDHALPKIVIYDPRLLTSLPPAVVGPSALNALAHCAEALWAAGSDPITDAVALDGARRIHTHLLSAYSGDDVAPRAQVLLGASMAGSALATAGTSLHHSLCHLLGGMFDTPHAETHAIVLPYAIAFLRPAVTEPIARLAASIGAVPDDLEQEIWSLARTVGTPRGLRELGLSEAQIAQAAQAAIDRQPHSPRPLEFDALHARLFAAWTGDPPERL
jgi:maleylacetate reductase